MQRLKLLLFRLLLACLPALGGCGVAQYYIARLPALDLSRAGTTVEGSCRILENGRYRLFLTLEPSGREVSNYLGSDANKGGGAGIPVHFQLVKRGLWSEQILFDEDVEFQGIHGWGDRMVQLSLDQLFHLKSGRYRMRATNLKEHPQLQYVPARFHLYYPRTK